LSTFLTVACGANCLWFQGHPHIEYDGALGVKAHGGEADLRDLRAVYREACPDVSLQGLYAVP